MENTKEKKENSKADSALNVLNSLSTKELTKAFSQSDHKGFVSINDDDGCIVAIRGSVENTVSAMTAFFNGSAPFRLCFELTRRSVKELDDLELDALSKHVANDNN